MTDNHSYNTPSRGATDWHIPLNENFNLIDADMEIRDTESNRGNYTATSGAKFYATDTGNVYLGDGSDWNPVATSGPKPEFDSVNGIPMPPTTAGAQDIVDELAQHGVVWLRPGTYNIDSEIVGGSSFPNEYTIMGAGYETTTIRANSSMESIISGRDGNFDEIAIKNLKLDANGNANHCLRLQDANVRFDIERLKVMNAIDANIKCMGAFNGSFSKIRSENGKHGLVIGDAGNFRSSDIVVHNCHMDSSSDAVVSVGENRYSTQSNPSIEFSGRCDFSGGTEGLVLGHHTEQVLISSCSFENNTDGLLLTSAQGNGAKPRDILIQNMTTDTGNSGQDVHITHGSNVTLTRGRLKSDTNLTAESSANGPIIEDGIAFDNPSNNTRNAGIHQEVSLNDI